MPRTPSTLCSPNPYDLPRHRAAAPIDGFVAHLIHEIMEPTWGVGMVWGHLRHQLGYQALKRTSSTLRSHKRNTLFAEAVLKVAAYDLKV